MHVHMKDYNWGCVRCLGCIWCLVTACTCSTCRVSWAGRRCFVTGSTWRTTPGSESCSLMNSSHCWSSTPRSRKASSLNSVDHHMNMRIWHILHDPEHNLTFPSFLSHIIRINVPRICWPFSVRSLIWLLFHQITH